MKKMFFELLTSPLTISDNYFVNYIIIGLIGFVAFKVAFKIVGDIGLFGEIGSILHWIIRFVVFFLLWFVCCIVTKITNFIISHIVVILVLCCSFIMVGFVAGIIRNHFVRD
jgi:putative membrane protein